MEQIFMDRGRQELREMMGRNKMRYRHAIDNPSNLIHSSIRSSTELTHPKEPVLRTAERARSSSRDGSRSREPDGSRSVTNANMPRREQLAVQRHIQGVRAEREAEAAWRAKRDLRDDEWVKEAESAEERARRARAVAQAKFREGKGPCIVFRPMADAKVAPAARSPAAEVVRDSEVGAAIGNPAAEAAVAATHPREEEGNQQAGSELLPAGLDGESTSSLEHEEVASQARHETPAPKIAPPEEVISLSEFDQPAAEAEDKVGKSPLKGAAKTSVMSSLLESVRPEASAEERAQRARELAQSRVSKKLKGAEEACVLSGSTSPALVDLPDSSSTAAAAESTDLPAAALSPLSVEGTADDNSGGDCRATIASPCNVAELADADAAAGGVTDEN